nr:hypothetical protein [Tanacetum cinerariifolium]
MHRLGKLLRNFRMKLREKYILPNLNTPSKLNELLAKYSAIVKSEEWVEFVNYTTTDAYKIENKEIKADEEPLHGIMWLKGRKEADDKIKEGTLNLDDGTDAMTVVFGKEKGGYARGVGSGVTYKRRERQQKDVLVKKLSTEMTEKDVTSMGAYEVDETQSSVVIRDKDARIQKKSNGLVTSEKKSNIVALGTVYKSDGKQMLHNQALPIDCYKVSIDSSLVDAACILDVTPPTTIQKISDYNSTSKLQSKRKNYVSGETMQRQARTRKSHKSLNYGS